MPFEEDLGIFCCRCVIEQGESVLWVSHAGGDWQMYCHIDKHDFDDEAAMERDLVVVHAGHLLARDPTLNSIAELPIDRGAERSAVGAEWAIFADEDQE